MGIILFVVTSVASFCILFALLSPKKVKFSVILIASLLVGLFIKSIGMYSGCADGWMSTNIGKQGACSHHGGVVSYVNAFGTISLVVSVLLFAVFFLFQFVKIKNNKSLIKRE